MSRLVIHQEPAGTGYRFAVQRVDANGVKAAPVVELADPLSQTLGSTDYSLGMELSWYLESYLDYPFGPNQQRAERITAALRAWGQQTFERLLGQGQARDFYRDATRQGHAELHLVVASDDARVLAWPWEALHDPLSGDLAHLCRIERQLDRVGEPPALHPALSQERIGILLVTARPFEQDVAYRSISRPLVELIHDCDLPAEVKLLRPPTFAQLRLELQANPGAYHIVHFDGHGGFGTAGLAGRQAGHQFKGPQGQLWFEQDDGSPDPITGVQLSQLLREHRIPIAVLNACQSGTLGSEAEDAFASVATALLRAGVRSVVAMGYSLYVSAAKEFLPAFYRRLFESASVAEATRAGRQALLARPERRPGFALQDWLVPVLYQQDPLPLCFAKQTTGQTAQGETEVPEAAQLNVSETPHGLIGRDSAVLALERASRRAPAALLVHGLGGVGKTTLARGYIEWLSRTHGLPPHIVWLSFVDIRSAEYVFNRLVEAVFGTNAMAAPDAQKWPALVKALRDNAWLIVWDNFESASGAADAGPDPGPDGGQDTGLDSSMPGADRQQFKQWLEQLRGGKTRVLLTSRSDEAWLGTTACWRIPLGGLQGEERQALAQAILADQGLRLDPKDQDSADLINSLEGHPLMMRAILPKLGASNAKSLMQAIEQYLPQADSTDPVERRLYATLRYVEEGLPPALKPLLYPIGLHEGHVDAALLADMARLADQPFGLPAIQRALALLEVAGLVQGIGNNIFRLHPALTRYLRARSAAAPTVDGQALAWQRGFVLTMAALADAFAPKELHQQRPFFRIMGGCVEQARSLAQAGEGFGEYAAIMQCLGAYAQNRRNLPLAQRHYHAFALLCEGHDQEAFAVGAYHQLGIVAQERRDLDAAEAWYHKSLEISERLGDEQSAAITYHQLGMVAEQRRDFEAAEAWYRKSLETKERLGNEHGAAGSYHQLGSVAQERRDFEAAEAWHRKALEISERLGNELGTAMCCHQLGMVAQGRRDFEAAEAWYHNSLEIEERLGNEHGAAGSYHQLGRVAQQRRDFEAAEAWYCKSLEISERLGNEHSAARSYHCLGMVAQQRRDFESAEAWYRKSLAINERLGDEHRVTFTRRALQVLEQLRQGLQEQPV